MSTGLQEWLALAIVVAVAAVGAWRWWARRKAKACGTCATDGCGVRQEPTDDDVRVLARPEVTFTKRD